MKLVKQIEEDNRSDVQKDMDALSEVRDELCVKFKSSKDANEKISLASSMVNVINARQNSELLQLRIWGLLDNYDEHHQDEDDETCPDCGGQMEEVELKPKKNNDNN